MAITGTNAMTFEQLAQAMSNARDLAVDLRRAVSPQDFIANRLHQVVIDYSVRANVPASRLMPTCCLRLAEWENQEAQQDVFLSDLWLLVRETENVLDLTAWFAADWLDPAVIQAITNAFPKVVERGLADPQVTIAELLWDV